MRFFINNTRKLGFTQVKAMNFALNLSHNLIMDELKKIFDLKDVISIAIGTSIGGVISWLVTHFYWLKSKPLENISKQIQNMNQTMYTGLRQNFVYDKYPEFSAFTAFSPDVPLFDATNLDRPQLHWIRFQKIPTSGERVKFLMKVIDEGLNFENPEGAKVIDYKNHNLTLIDAGFGCIIGELQTEKNDKGMKTLTITLTDNPLNSKPNTYSATVTIFIQ
jgi:hypothetical protein